MIKILLLTLFVAVLSVSADIEQKKETLVLLDNLATRETHSIFFKNLQGKKFTKKKIKSQLIENVIKKNFIFRSRF